MSLSDDGRFDSRSVIYTLLVLGLLHFFLTPFEYRGSSQSSIFFRVAIGFLLVGFLGINFRVMKSSERLAAVGLVLIFWLVLLNIKQNPGILLYAVSFIFLAFCIAGFLNDLRARLIVESALSWLLVFWVSSLFFQIALYVVFGTVLDLHGLIYPSGESRITSAGAFLRFTGIHTEPGTFANWVYGLIIIRAILSGRLFDWLNTVAVTSFLFTLSAWGAMTAIVYFTALVLSSAFNHGAGRRRTLVIGFSGACVLVLYAYQVFGDVFQEAFDYLSARSELADTSGFAKLDAINGFRQIWPEIVVLGMPLSYDFCNGCLSPQDVGVFINLAVRLGVLAGLTVFCVIAIRFFSLHGLSGVLVVTPLLFAKYYYFDPVFWLIFTCCFLRARHELIEETSLAFSSEGRV